LKKTAILNEMAMYSERPAREAAVADLVVCTWIDRPGGERHPVLPDACIDLVWDGAEVRVAGPDTLPYAVTGEATFVGIRFRPGAAAGVLGVPASELLDQNLALRELWGTSADELAERLFDAGVAHAPRVFEEAVMERRRRSEAAPDPVVLEFLAELSRDRGAAARDLAALSDGLGVSQRTLRRRCVSAIGYGPKMVDRVLRFRRAVRLIHADMPVVAAAYLAGYADQAHLTRELQSLGGLTPGQVRRKPGIGTSGNGYP
jgi:AraC-like DNA-binding protein